MAPQSRTVSTGPGHGTNMVQDSTKDTKPTADCMQVTNLGESMREPVGSEDFLPPRGWDAPGTFLLALRRIPLDQAQVLLNRSFQLGLRPDASIKDIVGYDTGLDQLSPDEILHIAGYAGLAGTGEVLPRGTSSEMPKEHKHSRKVKESLNGGSPIELTQFPDPPWDLASKIDGPGDGVAPHEPGTPDSTEQMLEFEELEEMTQVAIADGLHELAGDDVMHMKG